MNYTFKDLVCCLHNEYLNLFNDLLILKKMVIVNEQNIKDYYFKINETNQEIELIIKKNSHFWYDLKHLLLKKYGIQSRLPRITSNNLLENNTKYNIFINTDIVSFKNIIEKIKTSNFYNNYQHPTVLFNNKFGSYVINIDSMGITLSGVSGYLKDVYLIYCAQTDEMQIKSYGPLINTNDLNYLINLPINDKLFNTYYQGLLNNNYEELDLITSINSERFKTWKVKHKNKGLVLKKYRSK